MGGVQFCLIVPLGESGASYPSVGFPVGPGHPSQPIFHPGHPDHGLPSSPGHPSQGLPGGGGYPSQGLPGGERPGIWPPMNGEPVPPETIQPPLPVPPSPELADKIVIAVYQPNVGWTVQSYPVYAGAPPAQPK